MKQGAKHLILRPISRASLASVRGGLLSAGAKEPPDCQVIKPDGTIDTCDTLVVIIPKATTSLTADTTKKLA